MDPDNRNSFDESWENVDYSEKWERFMLLWSTTPEVFIGSCLLSIFAFIGTIFLSKLTDNTLLESMDQGMDDNNMQNSNYGDYARLRKVKQVKRLPKALVNQKKSTFGSNDDEDLLIKYKYKKSIVNTAILSSRELAEEKKVQQEQLKAIFNFMKNKTNSYGMEDVKEIEEQMKLYI